MVAVYNLKLQSTWVWWRQRRKQSNTHLFLKPKLVLIFVFVLGTKPDWLARRLFSTTCSPLISPRQTKWFLVVIIIRVSKYLVSQLSNFNETTKYKKSSYTSYWFLHQISYAFRLARCFLDPFMVQLFLSHYSKLQPTLWISCLTLHSWEQRQDNFDAT